MTDIVERLRKVQRLNGDTYSSYEVIGMVGEAADTIDELLAVLEKIASLPPRSTAGPSLAQSALDTMKVLKE